MKVTLLGPHCFQEIGPGQWRVMQNISAGIKEIEISEGPFIIGRATDCQLVLPESSQLRSLTSRWHCHFIKSNGKWSVADGGDKPHPDTGKPRPSITGTKVNGRKIAVATPIKPGDLLEAGPWQLEVSSGDKASAALMDAGDILTDVAKGTKLTVDAADPKLKAQFGKLHELVQRLSQIPSIEESLTALLSYATNKIEAAEVAAVLLTHPDSGFEARLAWEKNMGRMPEFRFSSALLQSLPQNQSFLLQSKLKDRSESQSLQDISSGMLLPLWGKGERLGILYLDNRRNGKTFTEEDLYLGSALASLITLQLSLERQAKIMRIEENMARYFAPDVVQRIIEQSQSDGVVGLEVTEKNVTVLFTDMEDFTKLSRLRTPREISEILNPYLETIARCIQAEGGHVNKFIGDAVMGIFGAQPGTDQNADPAIYAGQAISAALAIPDAWKKEAERLHLPASRVRIGINSGRAVVGNIGYSARLEYSVLGDTVNIASRLEKLAPPNRAAVSESTRELCSKAFEFESAGEKEVKGVGPLKVFIPVRPL